MARLPELSHKSSAKAQEVMQRVVAAKLTGLTQNIAKIKCFYQTKQTYQLIQQEVIQSV